MTTPQVLTNEQMIHILGIEKWRHITNLSLEMRADFLPEATISFNLSSAQVDRLGNFKLVPDLEEHAFDLEKARESARAAVSQVVDSLVLKHTREMAGHSNVYAKRLLLGML